MAFSSRALASRDLHFLLAGFRPRGILALFLAGSRPRGIFFVLAGRSSRGISLRPRGLRPRGICCPHGLSPRGIFCPCGLSPRGIFASSSRISPRGIRLSSSRAFRRRGICFSQPLRDHDTRRAGAAWRTDHGSLVVGRRFGRGSIEGLTGGSAEGSAKDSSSLAEARRCLKARPKAPAKARRLPKARLLVPSLAALLRAHCVGIVGLPHFAWNLWVIKDPSSWNLWV